MKTSIIRIVLTSLLAGLFVASVGMASAGSLGYFRVSASEKAKVNPHSPTSKGEKPRADEGTVKPEGPGDTVSREAECRAAAGMSTAGDGEEGSGAAAAGETAEEKKTGLDRAIEVVLANCIKNPQAPGLLNALRHLADNRDRHLAREAAKAERRAAREAAKDARQAAKGHGKGSE
ncbi:MAG: hypothetical protein ACRDHO_06025 [Actinomycetota bacterium]